MARRTTLPPIGHASAERRSVAMHREIAAQLDAPMVERARERLTRWQREGAIDPHWASEWHRLLALEPDALRELIGSEDPAMIQLRQSTPFAGELPPAARWRILREVR